MDVEAWLREKDVLRKLCGEMIVDVLWHPEIVEQHTNTKWHDIVVRRDYDVIRAEIRRLNG